MYPVDNKYLPVDSTGKMSHKPEKCPNKPEKCPNRTIRKIRCNPILVRLSSQPSRARAKKHKKHIEETARAREKSGKKSSSEARRKNPTHRPHRCAVGERKTKPLCFCGLCSVCDFLRSSLYLVFLFKCAYILIERQGKESCAKNRIRNIGRRNKVVLFFFPLPRSGGGGV